MAIAAELLQFRVIWPRCFVTMEHSWSQTLCTLSRILDERSAGQARVFWTFPRPHNICNNSAVTATTRAQHITYVVEGGLYIKHDAVDIHFSHSSAIDGLSLTFTPGADIVWVSLQSLSDATALLLDPHHAKQFAKSYHQQIWETQLVVIALSKHNAPCDIV